MRYPLLLEGKLGSSLARTRLSVPPRLVVTSLVLACLASLPLAAQEGTAPEADAIVGLWATKDEEAHVEITREGDTYAGKIVWLQEPIYPPDDERGMAGQKKVDRNNPDEKYHRRPIIGLEIMEGFDYAGDGLWKGGRIYDPDNGKTYKCKVTLQEDGSLHVRGYIGFSLIGRTSTWTPVEEAP